MIFLFVPLTLPIQSYGAADTYELLSKNCSSPGNLASGYQMNLRQFLATLPSNVVSNQGFFNGSVGSVYGMAMCQADMPWPDHCESCLQAASAGAPEACPSSNNASVAYRGCVLRYWDTPVRADTIDNVFNNVAAYYAADQAANVPADTHSNFQKARDDLFTFLNSSLFASPLKIATVNTTFNDSTILRGFYGLAQCNRDLPDELCSYYITTAVGLIPNITTDIQWSEGASLIGYPFYLRYDLRPFQVYWPDDSSGPPPETTKDALLQYKDCSSTSGNGSSTSSSDPYQANLNKFLTALPSNVISNSGFFNGTMGSAENTVFGVAMCQADVSWPDQCKSCLQAASTGAPTSCPSSNDASVAYRGCVLRYSNTPILATSNQASDSIAFYTQDHAASVPNTTAFQQTRNDLLADLAGAAVSSPSMIASSNRAFNSTHKLYGLAQCNKDLPTELCSQYITSAVTKLAPDVQWSEGMSITGFNVYIRGYMAPEFVKDGRVGCEYDIFSLGVLIMVIVIGKGPGSNELSGTTFINEIRQKLDTSNPQELRKYACLDVCDSLDAVKTCLALALDCVKEKPEDRPTTKDICARLHITASDTSQVEVEVK
nr:unnamed protein product [Digitaria exilis]